MVARKSSAVEQIKAWFFPILLSIFGTYIWQDIREIKSDVKALMQQSNIDKTRIDNLERHVFSKASIRFKKSSSPSKKNHNRDIILVCTALCMDGRNKKVFETELV